MFFTGYLHYLKMALSQNLASIVEKGMINEIPKKNLEDRKGQPVHLG